MDYDSALSVLRGILFMWQFDPERQEDAAALRVAVRTMLAAKAFMAGMEREDIAAAETPVSQNAQLSIDDLGLSHRVRNCLQRRGIMTVDDLLELDYRSFHTIRGLGTQGMQETREALERAGYDASELKPTMKGP